VNDATPTLVADGRRALLSRLMVAAMRFARSPIFVAMNERERRALRDPRVFTIAPGAPFLDTLARALLDGRLVPGFPHPDQPEALARAVIYLPTQRAARALATRLSELISGDAALLPRIVPLGEADDAELELAAGLLEHADPQALIAPPIAPLERRLLLAGLIQTFARSLAQERLREEVRSDATRDFLIPTSAADAVAIAADLEALMDDFTFEDVPVARLADLVDGEYSQYFDFTLRFLRIATEMWPAILKERQASDPAERRSKLIDAQAALFRRQTPPGPVIAAGSTGSIPSTARLLGAIARLENGAVVLPGIDRDLDDESFAQIGWIGGAQAGSEARDPGSGHPQAMMARLVAEELAVSREAIVELAPHEAETPGNPRARFFSEAMRPAETTDRWSALETRARTDLALAGTERITLVEANDEREEALCIAIALREALEVPEKTAALITPDRGLAARVCAELGRWGVRSADSAGTPLGQSPAGRLARLAADAALAGFDPPSCLALIAHPHLRLGLTREAMRRAANALEIGVLRGPPAAPGLDGLEAALARRRGEVEGKDGWRLPRPVKRLTAQDWEAAADLISRLREAFAGFPAPDARGDDPLALTAIAAHHRAVVEELLRLPDDADTLSADDEAADALADWRAEPSYDGLFALFDECGAQTQGALRGSFADYPAFFASLAAQRVVRPDLRDVHRRVKILGPLEARLIAIDRVVLGGLDEGVWPPAPQTDAFLNRPMRSLIGLLPPERRIGQSAHDFVQAACGEEVIITRAKKRNGAPTVPSRFVQRMKAFAGEELFREITERGARLRYLARHADTDAPAPPLARPNPRPDPGKFPRKLSVTRIETLLRDPYAIFAQYVLGLDPLPDLAAAPGPSERGTLVHALAELFVREYEEALPPNRETARATMQAILDAELAPYAAEFPDIHADWLPRLTRIAMALVDWEYARRDALARVHVELKGEMEIPLGGDTFTLSARADRIEQRRDGGVTALDFKSGKPPSAREIGVGFSPQLTLEAAILMRGGFKEIGPVGETPELVYVRASGGREALTETIVKPDRNDARAMPEIIEDHVARLRGLVARFIKGELGYMSRPYPQFARKYNDYDHLARVAEWSASGGGGGGEGEGA
jgi:ATP-dependent helicase/nuclease subunit B